MPRLLRLYLAGPDVFRPDAAEQGERLRRLCAAAGAEGLFPLHAEGVDIRRACLEMLDTADAVIANITPFRGTHMDPGTAFEIGYAEARGTPVFFWSADPRPLKERHPSGADGRDGEGYLVEDWGKTENLMIVPDGRVVGASAEEAIAEAVAALGFTVRNRDLQRRTRRAVVVALAVSLAAALLAGTIANRLIGW
ncbi:nucleoside 2-deoxyribosyltransferase [Ancylobacter polymorphus]|uniref:Nucleoside 2-deoxyribosyltransferase n=1 Tax=Ancylobacter polymorphus TaxID=223390 RepID=A0A9E7CUW5_9HYPH|nr:nucleoside 2-deoxyribosyltransferase [Ancylobacter polymorphus]UOK70328.1 nucleoside 2-deoxyribosyltransferase [Ancylobacter polymorphus]